LDHCVPEEEEERERRRKDTWEGEIK